MGSITNSNHDTAGRICLDIAIDHRLRRLFLPVIFRWGTATEEHLKILRTIGSSRRRANVEYAKAEIHVTTQLAEPARTGGIAVILKQPRDSHPFGAGLDATIQDCATFKVIDEAFRAVSRGTLSIKDVSVFDSLPFIEQREEISIAERNSLRNAVYESIQEKRPDVVISMWYDEYGAGRLDDFQCIGVGQSFQDTEISLGGDRKTARVNAFHPSHAMNYNPDTSCFRQLLLLEITQACRLSVGKWKEEPWMQELRSHCVKENSEAAQNTPKKEVKGSVSFYARRLKENLREIKKFIASQAQNRCQEPVSYKDLLGCKVSEHCNNASHQLRRIWEIKQGREEKMEEFARPKWWCKGFLWDSIEPFKRQQQDTPINTNWDSGTNGFYTEGTMGNQESRWYRNHGKTRMSKLIFSFLKCWNLEFRPVQDDTSTDPYTTDFRNLSKLLLEFAADLEDLLEQLCTGNKQQEQLETRIGPLQEDQTQLAEAAKRIGDGQTILEGGTEQFEKERNLCDDKNWSFDEQIENLKRKREQIEEIKERIEEEEERYKRTMKELEEERRRCEEEREKQMDSFMTVVEKKSTPNVAKRFVKMVISPSEEVYPKTLFPLNGGQRKSAEPIRSTRNLQ